MIAHTDSKILVKDFLQAIEILLRITLKETISDRKIFLSWKIKKTMRGIRTHELTRIAIRIGLKSYPLDYRSLYEGIHRVFLILS